MFAKGFQLIALGGLPRAIEIAKEEAGIPAGDEVVLDHYPKKKGLLALVLSEEGPFGVMDWLAYHFLHEEVIGSIRMLMDADMMMEPLDVR